MAIIDPKHFLYERNHFPFLTDKEFEVMVLYCQLMSIQKVAEFLDRTDSVVTKHLNRCKFKLKAKGDYDLFFFLVTMYCTLKNGFPSLKLMMFY